MTSNVTPDEARAIAQALSRPTGSARPAHVESRQFDRPLRLSMDELDALRDKFRKRLPAIERELAPTLRCEPKLALVEIGEVNVDDLGASLAAPFAALRFEIDAQPGWLVWDCATAIAALELAFGADAPSKCEPRRLTGIERSMFARVLAGAVKQLAQLAGLEAGNFSAAQDAEQFGGWRQGGAQAEKQRLLVAFDLELGGLGSTSTWKLYLPGVVPAAKGVPVANVAELPQHLSEVSVVVQARLGANEVPLEELLALEVGDVIPLRVAVGEPLYVSVEEHVCMRAVLGRSQGQLAVQVTSLELPKSDP